MYAPIAAISAGELSSSMSSAIAANSSSDLSRAHATSANAGPAALEAIPEHHRVRTVGEFIDAPVAVRVDVLDGRLERGAVQFAEAVDFVPVAPDVPLC